MSKMVRFLHRYVNVLIDVKSRCVVRYKLLLVYKVRRCGYESTLLKIAIIQKWLDFLHEIFNRCSTIFPY